MKLLSILLFIILPSAYGQSGSVADLDLKYGFKHLKFGKNYLNYKNVLSSTPSILPHYPTRKSYDYINVDIKDLYGVEIKNIQLGFCNDQLLSIQLNFPFNISTDDFDRISYSLGVAFGKGEYKEESKSDYGYFWSGKKVKMQLLKFYDEDLKTYLTFLSLTEIQIEEQCVKSEF